MGLSVEQVTTLLEDVLFESPTVAAANAATWAAQSASNSSLSTVSGLTAALVASPEGSIVQQVERFYLGALGRSPEGFELQYYVAIAEKGLTASQIAQGSAAVPQGVWNQISSYFAHSPEFQQDVATSGDPVTMLYKNILGRGASTLEVDYYKNLLSTGTDLSTLLHYFVNSPEYQGDVQTEVAQALEVIGTTAVPSTTPAPATTPSPAPAPTSVTLTTGTDSATANTFYATLGGTDATLQATDSLTGGGAPNELVITDGAGISTDLILPVGLALHGIQVIDVTTAENAGELSFTHSFDLTNYASITALNVISSGNDGDFVAAGPLASITDTAQGTGGVSTFGGLVVSITSAGGPITVSGAEGAVSITASGIDTSAANIQVNGGTSVHITANGTVAANSAGGSISVGASVVPTGAVTIIDNFYLTDTSGPGGVMPPAEMTTGAITVNGGSSVDITMTLAASHAALVAGVQLDLGNITVNGSGATTSVSVTLPAPVLASTFDSPGVAGVTGVAAVTAAPGVTGVAMVAAVAEVPASSPRAGFYPVGVLTINDAAAATPTTASNTISTLTLSNLGGVIFNGNALTTLDVAGYFGWGLAGMTINNSAAGAATNTTLTVNADAASGQIIDSNNEITTLEVVTSGTSVSRIGLQSSGLTGIHISGTQVNDIGTIDSTFYTHLTDITVSGGAGLGADISNFAGTLDGSGHLVGASVVTTSSTGTISLTMDASATNLQRFIGASGTDLITIGSDVTQYAPVAAGSAANNELILTSTTAGAYTLAGTGTYATGFSVLGIGGGDINGGAIDLAGWASPIQTIDIQGEDGDLAVSHFGGHTIEFTSGYGWFSGFWGAPASLAVTTNDTAGPSDSMTVACATWLGLCTVEQLTLADAAGNGIGTLNLTTTSDSTVAGIVHILTLNDNGLSVLNISGVASSVEIQTLNETSTPAASLTINAQTNAGSVGITILNDAALAALTVTGNNWVGIGTLNDSVASLTLTNSSNSHFSVDTVADVSLTSLTLGANVVLGQDNSISDEQSVGLVDSVTSGVTVLGGGDDAHVTLNLGGAGASAHDSITLGNGNDYIADASAATSASVTIQVGTGSNYIVLGSGATAVASSFTVTLGLHSTSTGIDALTVGTAGANFTSAANYIVTGIAAGDTVTLSDPGSLTVTNAGTVAGLATLLAEASAAGDVVSGVIGGNTYVVETSAANVAAQSGSNTTVIELMGLHTLASTAAGILTVTG